ncbi:MAG: VWA domain-containing protein [Planctomycetota bacterium]
MVAQQKFAEQASPPPVPLDVRTDRDDCLFENAPPQVIPESLSTEFASLSLETKDISSNLMGRQRSNAWWGSLGLHAIALILFALLLAPASLGTATVQTIILSMRSESDLEPPPVLIESAFEQDTSLDVDQLEIPEPVPIPVTHEVQFETASNKKAGGSQKTTGRSNGSVNSGSSGSFFGVQATGQSFVYVVDRSGSMNGRRYRRALDELTRSIDALTEDQRFLVVLFSSGKRVMFDTADSKAEMIPATDENKSRLREWLYGVEATGGTHPNAALRMALSQSPEAVFMLSDGAFNQQAFNVPSAFMGGGGGPFDIATSNGGSIPIHSIAFEDPQSCKNMKRMASLTGGDYRFVSAGQSNEQVMKQAEMLLSSKDAAQRPNQMRHLLSQLTAIVSDEEEIRSYAKRVHVVYQRRLATNESAESKLRVLNDELIALNRLDPRGILFEETFQDVRRQVAREAERLTTSQTVELMDAIQFIGELSKSEVDPFVAEAIVGCIFSDGGESTESIIEAIEQLAELAKSGEQKSSRIVESALVSRYENAFERRIERYKERDQYAEAIQTLRVHLNGSMKRVIEKLLRVNTFEILDKIRVEARAKNRGEANRLKAELDDGFASDRNLLSSLRRQFSIEDRNAAKLLAKVKRLPEGARRTDGLQQILTRYPFSRSAGTAKEMLDQEAASSKRSSTSVETSSWSGSSDDLWICGFG